MSDFAQEPGAEELLAAIKADRGEPTIGLEVPQEPSAEADAPTQDDTPPPAQEDQELTLKALLGSLPPEFHGNVETYLQSRERAMQGDYTRKTQALAEERKEFEAELAFIESIRTDPDAALEFHRELTQALTEAGVPLGEAQALAAEAVQDAADSVDPAAEYGDDPDAELLARIATLEKRFADVDAREAQTAYEREVKDLESSYQLAEAEIRQENPSFKDEDIEDIYAIAFALEGDLHAATARYKAMLQRQIGGYVEMKQELESEPEPGATGPSIEPKRFESLEDAHAAAEEHLRNYFGNA